MIRIIVGDALTELAKLPAESVHCCVTSPPYYGLRDYGVEGQLGLEATPDAYVAAMVAVFREVRRVLRTDGVLFLNIGDSYAGSGKGGNPDAGKQATNAGSQSIGVLYGKDGDQQRHAAVTNVTRRTFRAGAGRADGIVDERAQRNRDGVGAAGGDIKAKDLIGIPWMLAFALRSDGWWLRQDIIWAKPNPMPESVTDRCTKAHEYLFLLSKSERYYFDAAGIAEEAAYPGDNRAERTDVRKLVDPMCQDGGSRLRTGNPTGDTRNKRSVWTIATAPFPEAHFATFPPALVEPCILAGCPTGGTVLDPFSGAGTTALVADRLGRNAIGIELNPVYAAMARRRIEGECPLFANVAD